MFSMNFIEFFQHISWEYIFIFVMMLGFVIESYYLYLINKQYNKFLKEYADVKKQSDELIQQLTDELEFLHNISKNIRS